MKKLFNKKLFYRAILLISLLSLFGCGGFRVGNTSDFMTNGNSIKAVFNDPLINVNIASSGSNYGLLFGAVGGIVGTSIDLIRNSPMTSLIEKSGVKEYSVEQLKTIITGAITQSNKITISDTITLTGDSESNRQKSKTISNSDRFVTSTVLAYNDSQFGISAVVRLLLFYYSADKLVWRDMFTGAVIIDKDTKFDNDAGIIKLSAKTALDRMAPWIKYELSSAQYTQYDRVKVSYLGGGALEGLLLENSEEYIVLRLDNNTIIEPKQFIEAIYDSKGNKIVKK